MNLPLRSLFRSLVTLRRWRVTQVAYRPDRTNVRSLVLRWLILVAFVVATIGVPVGTSFQSNVVSSCQDGATCQCSTKARNTGQCCCAKKLRTTSVRRCCSSGTTSSIAKSSSHQTKSCCARKQAESRIAATSCRMGTPARPTSSHQNRSRSTAELSKSNPSSNGDNQREIATFTCPCGSSSPLDLLICADPRLPTEQDRVIDQCDPNSEVLTLRDEFLYGQRSQPLVPPPKVIVSV